MKRDTFVQDFYWVIFFKILPLITPIMWLRKIPSLHNDFFTDAWVLGNLGFSLICWIFLSPPLYGWWKVFLVYAGFRVAGIIIYQTNILLFDPYYRAKRRERHSVRGYRRIVLLLLHNYIEILVWFAFLYRNFNYLFHSERISLDSIWGSLYFSLVTMSTLGYGDICPTKEWGLILIILQTLVGIFIVLLILTRFISFLPKPLSRDPLEKDTGVPPV